jgi:hypothetical protein
MQTIREAKIVIHLEQGKVELKAPDLSKILADQQKHIDQTQRLTQEMLRLEAAQRAAAAASAGGGGGTGPRGSGLAPGVDEAERAFQRLYNAQMKYLSAQQNIGEGFFLMARAATLFSSSSDDSFDRLIRNLAQVQAYFDVYKGFTNTIRGTVEAIKALQKAEIEAAIASGQMTRAQIESLRASQSLAGGIKMLAIAISDVAVVMVAITSTIAIVTSLWDIFTTTAEEVEAANEGVRRSIEAKVRAMEDEFNRERELQNIRRQNMSDMEKAANLHRSVFAMEGIDIRSWRAREQADSHPSGPAAAAEVLESENRKAYSVIGDLQEEIGLRRQILQTELEARDAKIDAIQQQERQLEMAQRQLQIEEQKLQAFKAQIGALDPMTLSQLQGIDQKMKAGVDLNQFELDTLQRSGGERGRREADKIYAKRFDAMGIDADTFLGGDGGGMAEARRSVDELTKALQELTKGLTAGEAIAKLEAEKEALRTKFDEFKSEQIKFIDTLLDTIKQNNNKLDDIREAIAKG